MRICWKNQVSIESLGLPHVERAVPFFWDVVVE